MHVRHALQIKSRPSLAQSYSLGSQLQASGEQQLPQLLALDAAAAAQPAEEQHAANGGSACAEAADAGGAAPAESRSVSGASGSAAALSDGLLSLEAAQAEMETDGPVTCPPLLGLLPVDEAAAAPPLAVPIITGARVGPQVGTGGGPWGWGRGWLGSAGPAAARPPCRGRPCLPRQPAACI